MLRLRQGWLAVPGGSVSERTGFSIEERTWREVRMEETFEEQGFSNDGSVWYRLRLRLPPNVPPLVGALQHARNAHRLYGATPDGRVIVLAESGQPGATAQETSFSRRPATFVLPDAREVVLTLQVANYGYRNGGPVNSFWLGTPDVLHRKLAWTVLWLALMVGIYVTIGVGFGLLWTRQRQDLPSLALCLLAFLLAFRTLVTSGLLEYLLPSLVTFEVRIAVGALTYLLLPGAIGWLLWTFLPDAFAPLKLGKRTFTPPRRILDIVGADVEGGEENPSLLQRFNSLAVGAAVVFSGIGVLLVLMLPPLALSKVFYGVRWLLLPLLAGVLGIAVVAFRSGRAFSRSVAGGLMAMVLAAVHDLLVASGVFPAHPYLIAYAFLAFIVVQAVVLAHLYARYIQASDEVRRTLENRVHRRTCELQAATVAAHAANIAKGQFLGAVSHELRTPLASMMGYAQILREELDGRISPQQHEFLGVIQTSGERLLQLINDLLDLAKIDSGRFDLQRVPVGLGTVLRDVHQQLYPLAHDKGLTFTLENPLTDDEAVVIGDAGRLRQVFINLVANAVKFTEQGGVHIALREEGDARLVVEVRDTGPGIPETFRSNLFERFTQEPRLYGQTQQGAGLGLSIAREFMQRMGGTIEVESSEGNGSTFAVSLPRAVNVGEVG